MNIQVFIFGQLTEIVHSSTLHFTNINDTNSLVVELNKRFPAIANSKYMIAVNKQAITGNTILHEGSTVALLPPFSGG